MKTAIVIGGSGLVGRALLKLLCSDSNYDCVKYFGRSNIKLSHEKLDFIHTNFENLEEVEEQIKGDVLFSTLGTTIRKAGGKEQQFQVDYHYQLNFATLAAKNGVSSYVLISSLGAHPNSRIFYSRIKGQLEQAIKKLTFNHTHILRPSLLKGTRKENRFGENLAIKLSGIIELIPFLRKYRAIPAKKVAKAMLAVVEQEGDRANFEVLEATELFKLGDSYSG